MPETPTGPELLEAVAAFLRKALMPKLSGRSAFHARVSANVLDIVRRQMVLGPMAQAAERDRLSALLGRQGSLETLNQALCKCIESGDIPFDDPTLIRHLWATTLDTLAVDQPTYANYRKVVAASAAIAQA